MTAAEVRPLTPQDEDFYLEHLARHFHESGKGEPFFHAITDFSLWQAGEYAEMSQGKWQKTLAQTGWERAWGWCQGTSMGTPRVLGHVVLRGGVNAAGLHRALLGIGVERSTRGQGVGRRLLETAIAWAKMQPPIEWIDLDVFAQNEAAVRLYQKLGFIEIGRYEDLYRLGSPSAPAKICELRMTLNSHQALR